MSLRALSLILTLITFLSIIFIPNSASSTESFDDKGYIEIKQEVLTENSLTAITEEKEQSGEAEEIEVLTTEPMALPKVSGSCKTYAHYTSVTAKETAQYKLLNSDECYTDKETGIRMVDDCYCAALGSYYGSTMGQKYLIRLSSGEQFKIILCDQKSDKHTDDKNQYAVKNKDIIEFYIDENYKHPNVIGDYGILPQFEGSIVSIEKII